MVRAGSPRPLPLVPRGCGADLAGDRVGMLRDNEARHSYQNRCTDDDSAVGGCLCGSHTGRLSSRQRPIGKGRFRHRRKDNCQTQIPAPHSSPQKRALNVRSCLHDPYNIILGVDPAFRCTTACDLRDYVGASTKSIRNGVHGHCGKRLRPKQAKTDPGYCACSSANTAYPP